MDWIAILKIAIAVIAAIIEFLGGGHFNGVLSSDQEVPTHLANYQWSCAKPTWVNPGQIQNGVFNGSVEMRCEIQGVGGGGVVALRNHLMDQVSRNSSHLHQGPTVSNFKGLPSNSYDHSVLVQGGDSVDYEMRGQTHVATNGFTELKSHFKATTIPNSGYIRNLKSLEDEISVSTSSRSGWYQITIKTTSSISKPWFVSDEAFVGIVQDNLEEKMTLRRERVMNDLASKL